MYIQPVQQNSSTTLKRETEEENHQLKNKHYTYINM